jgi:hypothetical protein
VLGFDAGCVVCRDLARRVEEQVGNKLEVRPLHDPQVAHWRKQALGEEAPWAPTLIEVKGGGVKAWTGLGRGIALSRRVGPAATWRVMQVIGEMCIPQSLKRRSLIGVEEGSPLPWVYPQSPWRVPDGQA